MLPCVKKSACLSEASFADFSKAAFFQVCRKNRPRLFGPFVAMTKGQRIKLSTYYAARTIHLDRGEYDLQ